MAAEQKYLQVTLKDDFKEVFKSESESTFLEQIGTSLAVAAFIEKRVTLARAAELAGKGLSEFIKILSKHGIDWMEYTEEAFKEDQEVLEELR